MILPNPQPTDYERRRACAAYCCNAIRRQNNIPPVMGGQDRTPEEIERDANILAAPLTAVVSCVAVCVEWLQRMDRRTP